MPEAGTPDSIGPYRVEEKLGEGGMGSVYKGFDESLGRPVALKVLSKVLASDGEAKLRFVREARAAAVLSHPNVAQVYQIGGEKESPFIAMEYIDGKSLEEMLASRGPLPPADALGYIIQVVNGLDAAWKKGIVHRDIKPANIIIHPDGLAKIVDFGLSKVYGADKSLTQSGMVMGTPRYMSPEQGEGKPLDFRADIYSLGATLYHLLVGAPPFDADTPVSVIVKHITSPVPDMQKIAPSLPRPVHRVIEHMLQKRPDNRPSSYDELREELKAALGSVTSSMAPVVGSAVHLPVATIAIKPVKTAAERKLATPIMGVLGIAALAIASWFLYSRAVSSPPGDRGTAGVTMTADHQPSPSLPEPPGSTPPISETLPPTATPEATPTTTPAPSPVATPVATHAVVETPAEPPPPPRAIPPPPPPVEDELSPMERGERRLREALKLWTAGKPRSAGAALDRLVTCVEAGDCAREILPSAAAASAAIKARSGDRGGAIVGYRKTLEIAKDPDVKVLAADEEGNIRWLRLREEMRRELARYTLTPEEAAELVPSFRTAKQQLRFAKESEEPFRPEEVAIVIGAYEAVGRRFPENEEAKIEAADGLTIFLLRHHMALPAEHHLLKVTGYMEKKGASWQHRNDELVFLALAKMLRGEVKGARKALKEATKISKDRKDPVRLIDRNGTVKEVPLIDALKLIRTRSKRRPPPMDDRDGGRRSPRDFGGHRHGRP